jgi:hypothetical protein
VNESSTKDFLTGALFAAVTVSAGFTVGLVVLPADADGEHEPVCPQEDSCSIDYHAGEWTIYEFPDVECGMYKNAYVCVDSNTGDKVGP